MENISLKPIKGIEEWCRKQFKDNHYIYYKRKGNYAECHCAECGKKYFLRTAPAQDITDIAYDIEKPERNMETTCRKCGAKAVYKPAGHTKGKYEFNRVCYGQKIDDEHFVFRIYYTYQKTKQGQDTYYKCVEDERIYLEKGQKPSRYDHYGYYSNDMWYNPNAWSKRNTGENWYYIVHPGTHREIKKTGMFKYVPVVGEIMNHWRGECGIIDYYIAAARYPDFEMIIKAGLIKYADALVRKIPVNPNPRGKTIADRLRINKDRIKDLIACKGDRDILKIYQFERRLGTHWTDEEVSIIKRLKESAYLTDWNKVKNALKYITPTRMRNYMRKQKMWIPGAKATWQQAHRCGDLRREYFDYLEMRADQGYDMTNDIILYPSDFVRRRDEMILETEKAKMDKRKKEVLEKFPKIASKYRRLSGKYASAAGSYIIRPAKNAAEIVEEGRILHHCVGGNGYLSAHNNGQSVILFLREAKKKDIPFVTIEIRGERIVQWYGAYDKKPKKKQIDAWLKAYTAKLKKKGKNTAVKKGAA